MNKKIEAIVKMNLPKNIKEVHAFIGTVNHYRDMWAKRSHLLHPLNALTSNKVKFKWNDAEHNFLMISSLLSPRTPY